MDITHLCTVKRQHSGTYLPRLPSKASSFARFKRRFRIWTSIYSNHPKCIEFFKSATGIRKERSRHVQSKNFYIIHPFSQFRLYYDMYMVVVFLSIILTRCGDFELMGLNTWVDYFYEGICIPALANIFMTFFTGYTNERRREVVLEPRKIAIRYLKTMFFVDIIAFTPLKLMILWMNEEDKRTIHVCINMIRLVGIARLHTVNQYVLNAAEYYELKTRKLFIAILYTCSLIVIVHCFIGIFFTVPQMSILLYGEFVDLQSWIRKMRLISQRYKRYSMSLLTTSALVLGASTGITAPQIWDEICLQIVTYIFGKFYTIFLTVIILHMTMSFRNLEMKYARIIDQLEEYMTYKDLPGTMRKRLRMYYDYKYQGKFIRDTAISSILSENLNREIKMHVCRKLVNSVTLFAGLSTKAVSEILEYLKSEIYLPNDTIIKAGDPGECMYLVSSGTVAVYTPSGKELCHLQDGAYFGEISLIMKDQLRTANVYAVEICEVYSLDRRRFKQYFMQNQDLYRKMYRRAEDRLDMLTVLEEYHRSKLSNNK